MAVRQRPGGDQTGKKLAQFPYPYNTDLHWLWGWGQRVQKWYDDERLEASELDGLIYNPCRHANDAMLRFSIDYAAIVNEIRKAHREVENRCEEAIGNPSDTCRNSYAESLEFLYSRIFKACELIAEREPPVFAGQQPTKGKTDKKTDSPKEIEKKLPPNDINDAARYIRNQRRLIRAKKRPAAGKKSLLLEHANGDNKEASRLDKALQPSRYGWVLEIPDN